MNKVTTFLLLLFILGCSKEQLGPEIEKGLQKNQTITVGEVVRNYHIYVPDNSLNAPVVLLFHGNSSSYDDILGFTGVKAPYKVWLDIAMKENIIILVPDGTNGSSNSRGWNDCREDASTNPQEDDVQLTIDLLDLVKTKYNSSTSKVFAVGTSNGGHFAIRLAEEIPDRITAFASIAASNATNSKCPNSTIPVSALFMNGTDDPIMPYDGGRIASNRGEVFSTESTISYWVQRNEADTTPEIRNLTNVNPNDNSTISEYRYKNGSDGTEVVLYKVDNGGHTEPSLTERYSSLFLLLVGKQNGDIEMANEVWNFFKTKTK